MVENDGNSAARPLAPGSQQKVALAVAGTIVAVAIVLAILVALRTPQYEAQSRVAYDPAGSLAALPAVHAVASPVVPGAAKETAAALLTDQQLAHLIDQFDLYTEQRRTQSTAALTGRLRERLVLTEPQPGLLQLAFRDADQAKATAVTNGIASQLADYEVLTSVPLASTTSTATLGRQTHTSRASAGRSRPLPATVPAPVVVRPAPSSSNYASSAYIAELTHQVDRVDATLHGLQEARVELETEQRQVGSKIEVLEKAERRAAEGRSGGRTEAARSERSVAEQDLAVQKAKLASLRERYTDAYPDVQATDEEIARLQARLASLPAAPSPSERLTATAEQADAREKLRQEKQRVERDLGENQASLDAENQRKISLQAQIQQVETQQAKFHRPTPPEVPVTVAPPRAQAVVPPPVLPGLPPAATLQVPVLPFRVVETAGPAALVTTSRVTLSLWLALGTGVLLALCFVPLVPAHYAAVVTTPEDLAQTLPEHVSYLGDVGRTEP